MQIQDIVQDCRSDNKIERNPSKYRQKMRKNNKTTHFWSAVNKIVAQNGLIWIKNVDETKISFKKYVYRSIKYDTIIDILV